jgi:hypothetical protein
MASVIENYSKFEVLAVGRFLQAEGVNQSEICLSFLSVYDQKTFSWEEVYVWYNKFKDGQTAVNGNSEKQRGRPKTSYTDEYCHCRKFW